MHFGHALAHLLKGKKLRLSNWTENSFIQLNLNKDGLEYNGVSAIIPVEYCHNGNDTIYSGKPNWDCLDYIRKNENWEIYDRHKKQKDKLLTEIKYLEEAIQSKKRAIEELENKG